MCESDAISGKSRAASSSPLQALNFQNHDWSVIFTVQADFCQYLLLINILGLHGAKNNVQSGNYVIHQATRARVRKKKCSPVEFRG